MNPTAEASQFELASLFDDMISAFGLDDRDNADDYDRLDETALHYIHAEHADILTHDTITEMLTAENELHLLLAVMFVPFTCEGDKTLLPVLYELVEAAEDWYTQEVAAWAMFWIDEFALDLTRFFEALAVFAVQQPPPQPQQLKLF